LAAAGRLAKLVVKVPECMVRAPVHVRLCARERGGVDGVLVCVHVLSWVVCELGPACDLVVSRVSKMASGTHPLACILWRTSSRPLFGLNPKRKMSSCCRLGCTPPALHLTLTLSLNLQAVSTATTPAAKKVSGKVAAKATTASKATASAKVTAASKAATVAAAATAAGAPGKGGKAGGAKKRGSTGTTQRSNKRKSVDTTSAPTTPTSTTAAAGVKAAASRRTSGGAATASASAAAATAAATVAAAAAAAAAAPTSVYNVAVSSSSAPSQRWGHTMDLVAPTSFLVFGGQGDNQSLSKGLWTGTVSDGAGAGSVCWEDDAAGGAMADAPMTRTGHSSSFDPEGECTVCLFRQQFVLEDAIEFHAFAPLEAMRRVTDNIPLERLLLRLKLLQACDQWHSSRVSTPLLPVHTVHCVKIL
jgi:hypothetical protein